MKKPPEVSIDAEQFWHDPYPDLAEMRASNPICFVPQLNATLLTRRDDIFVCEKNTAIFSSDQPGGLMTVLMGENMMRKDGDAHLLERKQAFPALSPRTVRDVWKQHFLSDTHQIIEDIRHNEKVDLTSDFAMPVSAHALRHITGLTCVTAEQMDGASQGMIDGVGNYGGDPVLEARCHAATQLIDDAIDTMLTDVKEQPNASLLSVLLHAGQDMQSIRANIKLAISGGQNEPRDAIAGCVWSLLNFPEELEKIKTGKADWLKAFEEYARWMSPIGMSPRRITQDFVWNGVELKAESRVFLMFGSANRDEDVFENADDFDITRDTSKAISFGAGPHFCAGAAAARTLIAEVALPLLFEAFPNMQLSGETKFGGWAFRGPLAVPVSLHH